MEVNVYQTERMNLKKAFEYLGEFKKEEFDPGSLLIMPEKWIKDIIDMDSAQYNDLLSDLENLTDASDCAIVPGSISLREDGKIYNTAPLIFNGHLLGWQRKISLFKSENETYNRGSEINAFKISKFKLGIAVCYDIDFPYYAKKLVSLGCDIIVNPSLIHSGFTDMWHLYIKSRSLENRIPIISVNSISDPFFGNSIAVDPYPFDYGTKIREHLCRSEKRAVFTINPLESKRMRKDRFEEDPGSYDLAFDNQTGISST